MKVGLKCQCRAIGGRERLIWENQESKKSSHGGISPTWAGRSSGDLGPFIRGHGVPRSTGCLKWTHPLSSTSSTSENGLGTRRDSLLPWRRVSHLVPVAALAGRRRPGAHSLPRVQTACLPVQTAGAAEVAPPCPSWESSAAFSAPWSLHLFLPLSNANPRILHKGLKLVWYLFQNHFGKIVSLY